MHFQENVKGTRAIIDHFSESKTRDKKCPWTTIPLVFVCWRCNLPAKRKLWDVRRHTSWSQRKGGSIQMEFPILSLHCHSHLKIFNWYSSSRSLFCSGIFISSYKFIETKPGHETLLKGSRTNLICDRNMCRSGTRNVGLGLWINLHSSLGGLLNRRPYDLSLDIPSLFFSLFTFSRLMFRSFG